MAVLKSKDISKMDLKSINDKIEELKMELIKSQAGARKSSGKTKEIKRAIARLKTFNAVKSAGKSN